MSDDDESLADIERSLPHGGLAWTSDEEIKRGAEEFKRRWPDKWQAWLDWCDEQGEDR